MLRGNIDQIGPDKITGWIYSDLASVTGQRVLAFSGNQCIGAADIGQLRQDLRDAGLGDGLLGFEIPIDLNAVKDANSVFVRLDCSDFSLFGSEFYKKISDNGSGSISLYTGEELDRLEWMNRQGWLTHEQFIGLKALNSLGFYQRTFSKAELIQAPIADRARDVYKEIVSALFRCEIYEEIVEVDNVSKVFGLIAESKKYFDIVCLFGSDFDCDLVEAGCSAAESNRSDFAIKHHNAAHQVLIVHKSCLSDLNRLANKIFLIRSGSLQ